VENLLVMGGVETLIDKQEMISRYFYLKRSLKYRFTRIVEKEKKYFEKYFASI
jgi:hypothetical protein